MRDGKPNDKIWTETAWLLLSAPPSFFHFDDRLDQDIRALGRSSDEIVYLAERVLDR